MIARTTKRFFLAKQERQKAIGGSDRVWKGDEVGERKNENGKELRERGGRESCRDVARQTRVAVTCHEKVAL